MDSAPPTPADLERRAQLHAAKLSAIVADRLDRAALEAGELTKLALPDGAGLVLTPPPSRRGDRIQAFFSVEADASLGAMLLLAGRHEAASVEVFSAAAAPTLARQARYFDLPIDVFRLEGRNPVPETATDPPPEPDTPEEALVALAGSVDADIAVVAEHGDAIAEVVGLEIARATVTPTGLEVRVGVGWADQELAAMLAPHTPSVERIRAAASQVRSHRQPGAGNHPLQRVAAERWLRHRLIESPEPWGLASLAAESLLEPRVGLRLSAPAAAIGTSLAGNPVLVVCSVGVNPELVPIAADLQAVRHPEAELWLAMPKADAHAAIKRQAAKLKAKPKFVETPPVTHVW